MKSEIWTTGIHSYGQSKLLEDKGKNALNLLISSLIILKLLTMHVKETKQELWSSGNRRPIERRVPRHGTKGRGDQKHRSRIKVTVFT